MRPGRLEAVLPLWHIAGVIAVAVFLFGLFTGSFLTVCAERIPHGEPVIPPVRRCPSCETPFKPSDSIAVVSWLFAHGKCRTCGANTPWVYPLVELLTGLLFVACLLSFGATFEGLKWAIFSSLILILSAMCFLTMMLPDVVNFSGTVVGIALSLLVSPHDGTAGWIARHFLPTPLPAFVLSLIDALLGIAVGAGALWLLGESYFRLRGRKMVGKGNMKLMALVGAFLGVRGAIGTLAVGFLLAIAIGLAVILVLYLGGWKSGLAKRASRRGLGTVTALRWTIASQYQLPLGTFLGIAALMVVFGTHYFAGMATPRWR